MNKAMSNTVASSADISVSLSVGIVGCGWLGSALAQQLIKEGVAVLATRSNSDNTAQLQSEGVEAKVLSLPAEQGRLNSHVIFNQQCLVIAITPQFRQGRLDYAEKVQQLVVGAKASSSVEKIILLSSSAIYNGLSGLVDENNKLDFSADKVSLLSQAEQAVLLFNESNDKLTNRNGYVLRLSGLVGPSRHPGKFLLNGRMLKSPQAIVNLIHQQDAIGLIQALLTSDLTGGIFNGVSPTQVTKKQYYQAAATALKLPAPVFEEDAMLSGDKPKIVSGTKTQAALNYRFVYADLLKWLVQGE
ncbi:SDR family NAD(P)-dependent oxidoreductase [Colwellia sp.]|uniref:SDR family NAD(P)-dependent oxidoreductase n=1 Tax=Colwellia sp. TaxID=56799 RepID=UPI0025B7EB2D|nr:SDR family NAD(P)-dependent oxidoreductase [Colwellia sp.]